MYIGHIHIDHILITKSVLQDQDDLDWKPHFFVLTQRRLVYSEVPNQDDAENEDDADTLLDHSVSRSSVASSGITGTGDQAELHFSEAWFHGNLERGRDTAEQMLYENAHMGDGTFIVRKSQVGNMELGWAGGIACTLH